MTIFGLKLLLQFLTNNMLQKKKKDILSNLKVHQEQRCYLLHLIQSIFDTQVKKPENSTKLLFYSKLNFSIDSLLFSNLIV